MELKIDEKEISAAIQLHLDEVVKKGIDYRTQEALNDAIAKAITPEVVSGYATAAVKALTDPDITRRIVVEMQRAIGEAVRMTMQEAILSVAARLRGLPSYNRSKEESAKMDELRQRLFPETPEAAT
jgi:hypothetical protein